MPVPPLKGSVELPGNNREIAEARKLPPVNQQWDKLIDKKFNVLLNQDLLRTEVDRSSYIH